MNRFDLLYAHHIPLVIIFLHQIYQLDCFAWLFTWMSCKLFASSHIIYRHWLVQFSILCVICVLNAKQSRLSLPTHKLSPSQGQRECIITFSNNNWQTLIVLESCSTTHLVRYVELQLFKEKQKCGHRSQTAMAMMFTFEKMQMWQRWVSQQTNYVPNTDGPTAVLNKSKFPKYTRVSKPVSFSETEMGKYFCLLVRKTTTTHCICFCVRATLTLKDCTVYSKKSCVSELTGNFFFWRTIRKLLVLQRYQSLDLLMASRKCLLEVWLKTYNFLINSLSLTSIKIQFPHCC